MTIHPTTTPTRARTLQARSARLNRLTALAIALTLAIGHALGLTLIN